MLNEASLHKSKFLAVLLALVLFLSFGSGRPVLADYAITCNQSETFYEKILDVFNVLDMRRTIMNMISALVFDGISQVIFNAKIEDVAACLQVLNDVVCIPDANALVDPECADVYDEEYCSSLFSGYRNTEVDLIPRPATDAGTKGLAFSSSRLSGSLMGVAKTLDSATNEPIPVNLAFYGNDVLSRVPFVGKAYAQEVTYSAAFLNVILVVWKGFRNASYAIIAIIMLVLGFMIMQRRKINQQAVVTAQFAIPRVIIALVLITFSYPIGATIAQLSWTMMWNAHYLVSSAIVGGEPGAPICDSGGGLLVGAGQMLIEQGLGGNISGMMVMLLQVIGLGFVSIPFVLLTVIIMIIGWALVSIVLLFAYLKMILHIIGSPIIFALGAIPGNETMTEEWFKKMVSYALTLPVITGTITIVGVLSNVVLLSFMQSGSGSGLGGITWWGGSFMAILLMPVINILGFFFAMQMPKHVETWIMGQQRKK